MPSKIAVKQPRLLIRPRPYAGESLVGFLLRVAEANGYISGYWIARWTLGVTGIANISDNDV